MSEQLGNTNEHFDNSPAHRFYLQRKAEILGKMQQALYDTLTGLGGQDAIDFLTSMQFDLTMEEGKMPTPAMLTEIEQFFPGFWPAVREKWQPLLDEGRILSQIELRRQRAQQDRTILEQYETANESEN